MKKVGSAPKLITLIEDGKDSLKIFIVTTLVAFLMLAFTQQGDTAGPLVILIFSLLIAFFLTLGIWIYQKVGDGV